MLLDSLIVWKYSIDFDVSSRSILCKLYIFYIWLLNTMNLGNVEYGLEIVIILVIF